MSAVDYAEDNISDENEIHQEQQNDIPEVITFFVKKIFNIHLKMCVL